VRPPGYWLRIIATRFCGPQTMERLVDPIVADLQTEYAALGEANAWRRRRLRLSTYVAFWKALSLHVVLSVGEPPQDQGARLRRAIGISFVTRVLFTFVMTTPPVFSELSSQGGWAFRMMLALLLIPQALPLSIPAAVCFGILYAMRAHRVTRRDLYGVLTIAALASGAVWVLMDSGIPRANQAFRELVFEQLTGQRAHLEPGLSELGFSGLSQRTDPVAMRLNHLWSALSLASLPLSLLALSVAQRIRGAIGAFFLALVAVVVYFTVLWVSDRYLRGGAALPILIVWAPNALFLAAALGSMPRWRREAAL
jgi:lipopolysaccharide export LptBFGC system permease protein LptF